MEHKEISELVNHEIQVSNLSKRLGTDFHKKAVSQLYEWWRTNRLIVKRTWNKAIQNPETIIYSNNECLLPDDVIQLKAKKRLGLRSYIKSSKASREFVTS